MGFDPFLYVAFAAGAVAGRLVRWRSPWVGRGAQATVVVLVALLGAELAPISEDALARTIPLALGFAAVVMALTAGLSLALRRRAGTRPHRAERPRLGAFAFPALLVLSVVAGFGLGRAVAVPAAAWIEDVLYALLFLTAFDLEFSLRAVRRAWLPVAAAVGGALGGGAVVALATGISWPVALATALAFGFYSLSGPLVAAQFGPALGLLAFLTNFLRENLTMLSAPVTGGVLGGDGLTALGGATAMDTTLFFITRYGSRDSAMSALATGLVLTLAATLVLPLLVGLPGA